MHGAISKYHGEGFFLNVDVASYYPALMIEYDFGSRNISNPRKFREIRDLRIDLKSKKNPLQAPLKLVINKTYGGMKDKFNPLYDPRQANNVCIGGQLLLLDLIEKLEPYAQLIQSNTDGILMKLKSMDDYDVIDDICYEWEQRTRMQLEFEMFTKVFQKDVNNYIIVPEGDLYNEKGEPRWKSKGAYVKKLSPLDYDLPIVNNAILEFFLKGIHPSETINKCDDLKEFQKIVKVSGKYSHGLYNPVVKKVKGKNIFTDGELLRDRTFRVFASKSESDGGIYKVKNNEKNPEKFANTPDRCFIMNDDINGKRVPRKLDKQWYVDLAIKRIKDFGVVM
jgi:DNA polymerase